MTQGIYNTKFCISKDQKLFEQTKILLIFIRKILLVHNILFILQTSHTNYYKCYFLSLAYMFLGYGTHHFSVWYSVITTFSNLFSSGHYLI